ncbi:MAG: hypothetical protein DLM70_00545 [Chloroflexi bacterium]|nr:MAG: hypothetical protein DLM70_00545 [Chloroflexota bacterium]
MKRSLILICLLLLIWGTVSVAVAGATSKADPPAFSGIGYWHTSGTQILDDRGQPIRIAAVTWYGMESSYWVPAGLDFQPYTKIMDSVRHLGYNAIRLPYSNELVERNPIVTTKVAANPTFSRAHAMQVLDSIVAYAQRIGLKIILDNHRGRAGRPKHINVLEEAKWYSKGYPEKSWIADWTKLAQRYRHSNAVIGFDLRNEPHTNGPGPWNLHAYLHQGAVWGPYRGKVDTSSDWRLAAQRASNAVLKVNPHLLIFVQGVQLYPDPREPMGVSSYWWSGILTPVKKYPVILRVPHQLVYSPHDWGPRKWSFPWFKNMSYASMQRVWHGKWSFLLDAPKESYAAPLWLGEFGTCTTGPQCVSDERPDNQAAWFQIIIRFLREHREVGWAFYALNGTNSNDKVADNGLLNAKWNEVSVPGLQASLASVQR